jgi:hypothetical protein
VNEPLALAIPDELVDAVAHRVVELLRQDQPRQELPSPWLNLDGACAYLGFSRNTLPAHGRTRDSLPQEGERAGASLPP